MAGCGGTGEVVDLVYLEPDRMRYVVPDQFEVGPVQQVRNVALLTGEEVIEADDIVPGLNKAVAEV